ncbi:MAG: GGDEF domain-containing protein [bacterium]
MNMEQHDKLFEENSKLKKKLRTLMEDYKSLTRVNTDLKNNIFIDDVTLLYNNRYLNIRLDEEMKRAKRYTQFLSIVLISVDSLTEEIKKSGLESVAEKLRRFGDFIRANLRDTDILSQLKPGVLALILPETNLDGASSLSERLKEQIILAYSNFDSANPNQEKALSIGIASYPTDARMIEELLYKGTEMLERSKNSPANAICSSLGGTQ